MAKTVVEKVPSPNTDISIFKISGVLGYHENAVLTKFFGECTKKGMTRLIMDFSELGSLGGGCARIIREAAMTGEIVICVVGASTTVHNFLEKAGKTPIIYESDQGTALNKVAAAEPKPSKAPAGDASGGEAATVDPAATGAPKSGEPPGDEVANVDGATTEAEESKDEDRDTEPVRRQKPVKARGEPQAEGRESPPILDDDAHEVAPHSTPTAAAGADGEGPTPEDGLKRRLLRYRSLFSLTADFGRIREKSRLLDAFLLTTITQTGTDSAAFLEHRDGVFHLTAWKGFETADPRAFTLSLDDVDQEQWLESPRICEAGDSPISQAAKDTMQGWGMPYIAPFIIQDKLEGLVVLGACTRGELDESASEFLMMLIDQTAIAYRNSQQLEQESQRTQGIVQSLMAMIGDHTLSRGDMETVVNYVHAVAQAMDYPGKHIQDLLHGTMLRDVGMIRVSDLIVQSNRELEEEEWAAIKRHPIEGADILRSMNFSEHTCDIVMYHHERFNGGGYPQGVRGTQIPLGARIVSVVESYAVMLQDRPTRPAMSREQSLGTLKENLGKRYDPHVVAVFVDIVEEEIRTGRKAKLRKGELLGVKG
jgi:hypothetical protein